MSMRHLAECDLSPDTATTLRGCCPIADGVLAFDVTPSAVRGSAVTLILRALGVPPEHAARAGRDARADEAADWLADLHVDTVAIFGAEHVASRLGALEDVLARAPATGWAIDAGWRRATEHEATAADSRKLAARARAGPRISVPTETDPWLDDLAARARGDTVASLVAGVHRLVGAHVDTWQAEWSEIPSAFDQVIWRLFFRPRPRATAALMLGALDGVLRAHGRPLAYEHGPATAAERLADGMRAGRDPVAWAGLIVAPPPAGEGPMHLGSGTTVAQAAGVRQSMLAAIGAPATKRSYAASTASFLAWCESCGEDGDAAAAPALDRWVDELFAAGFARRTVAARRSAVRRMIRLAADNAGDFERWLSRSKARYPPEPERRRRFDQHLVSEERRHERLAAAVAALEIPRLD